MVGTTVAAALLLPFPAWGLRGSGIVPARAWCRLGGRCRASELRATHPHRFRSDGAPDLADRLDLDIGRRFDPHISVSFGIVGLRCIPSVAVQRLTKATGNLDLHLGAGNVEEDLAGLAGADGVRFRERRHGDENQTRGMRGRLLACRPVSHPLGRRFIAGAGRRHGDRSLYNTGHRRAGCSSRSHDSICTRRLSVLKTGASVEPTVFARYSRGSSSIGTGQSAPTHAFKKRRRIAHRIMVAGKGIARQASHRCPVRRTRPCHSVFRWDTSSASSGGNPRCRR